MRLKTDLRSKLLDGLLSFVGMVRRPPLGARFWAAILCMNWGGQAGALCAIAGGGARRDRGHCWRCHPGGVVLDFRAHRDAHPAPVGAAWIWICAMLIAYRFRG